MFLLFYTSLLEYLAGNDLGKPFGLWFGFIISFKVELDYTYAWIILAGYKKY